MFRIIISLFVGVVTVGEFALNILITVSLVNHSWVATALLPVCLSVCLSAALNFTCDWAEAKVATNATYKSFSNAVVSAEVGLHVGLYGINVTLKGECNNSTTPP